MHKLAKRKFGFHIPWESHKISRQKDFLFILSFLTENICRLCEVETGIPIVLLFNCDNWYSENNCTVPGLHRLHVEAVG